MAALLLTLASSDAPFIVAHKKATLTRLKSGVKRVFASIDIGVESVRESPIPVHESPFAINYSVAVLAWLSIIAYRNKDKKPGEKLVPVSDVVKEYWASYGRNFFSRYDYEECESEGANKMIDYLRDLVSKSKPGDKYGSYVLQFADDFAYTDPADGIVASKQGVRFVFSDASRIIFCLSGTSSAGATVRMYIEQFEPDVSKHDMDAQTALKPLIDLALSVSKLKDFTGREKPTVIT